MTIDHISNSFDIFVFNLIDLLISNFKFPMKHVAMNVMS